MKKGLTELVFILDRSGSMAGMESDTVGGFNSFIEKQKKEDGSCFVSTVLFDNYTEVIHDRTDLGEIAPLTEKEYYVRGSTALLDALGGAIRHIRNVHKYAREEDRPEHTIFVITTDGLENASREYSYDKVSSMVTEQKEKYGWEFIFLGANIDAVKEARRYGISEDRAVTYINDSEGSRRVYAGIGKAVSSMRACCSIAPDWNAEIAEDTGKRAGKKNR